jgi:hypothetical protein
MKYIIAPLALCLASAVSAQQATPELQALDDATPGTLINDPSSLGWTVFGADQTSKTLKSADIPGGGAALQITVSKLGANPYDAGTNAPITAKIKSGTDITALFWARAPQSSASDGKGRITVRFQKNAAPYPGFGESTLQIEREWKLYQFTAKADRDIAAGQAVLAFQLAGAKQTIEIGQTIIVSGATSIINDKTPASIELHPKLVGKGNVITDYSTQKWPLYGSVAAQKMVPAKEVPGGQAVQFEIAAPGANPHDVGLSIPVTRKIEEEDILILAVLARTVSAATPDGKGRLGVRVQQNAAPYPGFADNTLAVGPNWGLYQVRTKAKATIEAGQGVVSVHLAGAKQVIEIGQVYLIEESAPAPVATPPSN